MTGTGEQESLSTRQQGQALGVNVRDLELAYGRTQNAGRDAITAVALDGLTIEPGERVGLIGPSGAGKTSLLYVLAGIEKPQRGQVVWNGVDLCTMGEGARDRWRRDHAGFVFQDFHLIGGMTPMQNVLAVTRFAQWRPDPDQIARAESLLAHFGAPNDDRAVDRLSRGEQQRVALARALVGQPRILFADEPTASLDVDNAALAADQLVAASEEFGCTLICVTHDPTLMRRMGRVIHLANGRLAPEPIARQ